MPTSTSDNDKRSAQPGGAELESLQKQVRELTAQVEQYLSSTAGAAFDRARENVGEAVSNVSAKGQEAAAGVREIADNFTGAIDESLKKRPYTTLAMAFGIGFLLAKLS